MNTIARGLEQTGKLLLRFLLVTAAPLALGAVIWVVLKIVGAISQKVCFWLEQCWTLVRTYWPTMLVFVVLLVIVLTVVEAFRTKRRNTNE